MINSEQLPVVSTQFDLGYRQELWLADRTFTHSCIKGNWDIQVSWTSLLKWILQTVLCFSLHLKQLDVTRVVLVTEYQSSCKSVQHVSVFSACYIIKVTSALHRAFTASGCLISSPEWVNESAMTAGSTKVPAFEADVKTKAEALKTRVAGLKDSLETRVKTLKAGTKSTGCEHDRLEQI